MILPLLKWPYRSRQKNRPGLTTFIFVDAFHTEAAYFHALGTFLAESGGHSILIACDLLASGSLKGFIIGEHDNRCKRIHPLLAAAMELLHFNSFLSSSGCEIEDVVKVELSQILKNNSSIHRTDFDEFLMSKEVRELLDSYEKFKGQTRRGLHGLTAQYWLAYIDLVCIYHNFSRSTRTFNQPNYSRWSVRRHDNLLRINETHPCLSAEFRNGRFGIKRTSKNFSRMPIYLTLELTINADAASQRTGINSFINSTSARQRWAQSHFFKNECCITSAWIFRFKQKGRYNCRSKEKQNEKKCRSFKIYLSPNWRDDKSFFIFSRSKMFTKYWNWERCKWWNCYFLAQCQRNRKQATGKFYKRSKRKTC